MQRGNGEGWSRDGDVWGNCGNNAPPAAARRGTAWWRSCDVTCSDSTPSQTRT